MISFRKPCKTSPCHCDTHRRCRLFRRGWRLQGNNGHVTLTHTHKNGHFFINCKTCSTLSHEPKYAARFRDLLHIHTSPKNNRNKRNALAAFDCCPLFCCNTQFFCFSPTCAFFYTGLCNCLGNVSFQKTNSFNVSHSFSFRFFFLFVALFLLLSSNYAKVFIE